MLAHRLLMGSGGSGSFTLRPLPAIAAWTIARGPANPNITVSAGEPDEQYVPAPVGPLPDGSFWAYVKGGSRLYAWKSTDGCQTFTIQNGGAAVLAPVAATWEGSFVVEPTATYDGSTGTIHLYYGARDANPVNWQWGHATAPDSDPKTFTRDAANPILTKANAQTQLGGGTTTDLKISSVIMVGSTFHFYGYVNYNGTYYLCQATGTSWNNPSGLSAIARPGSDIVYETPSVIRIWNGTHLLLYAAGGNQPDPRSIFAMTSPDGATWTTITGTVLAPTGAGWEQLEAYCGQFVRSSVAPFSDPYVDGSGRWLFMYSGLSTAPDGQGGLAYITV